MHNVSSELHQQRCIHSLMLLFLFLLLSMLPCQVWAQRGEGAVVDPELLSSYGDGYDLRLRRLVAAGGRCVEFDAENLVSAGGSYAETSFDRVTSSSSLATRMMLSASSSLSVGFGGFGASAGYKMKMLNESQVSHYTESVLASALIHEQWWLLNRESVRLKQRYVDLLRDPSTRPQFTKECGDSFVLGIQKAREFYGMATVTNQDLRAFSEYIQEWKASGRSWFGSGGGALDWAQVVERTFTSRNLRITAGRSDIGLTNPTSVQELVDQFRSFSTRPGDASLFKVFVAPYTFAAGYPLDDPLTPETRDEQLSILSAALWDLRTLIEDAEFIQHNPSLFALGLTPERRAKRLSEVEKREKAWRVEYEELREVGSQCIQAFTMECEGLVGNYRDRDVLLEGRHLPHRYQSDCGQRLHLTDLVDANSELQHSTFSHVGGDTEMGGGPGAFDVTARMFREGPELKITVRTRLEEQKADRSRFEMLQSGVIFDLAHPRRNVGAAYGDLIECDYSPALVDAPVVNAPDVFGTLSAMTGRHPRGYQRLTGVAKGILRSISCEADRKGDDRGMGCSAPELRSLDVALLNKLDMAAEGWSPLTTKTTREQLVRHQRDIRLAAEREVGVSDGPRELVAARERAKELELLDDYLERANGDSMMRSRNPELFDK